MITVAARMAGWPRWVHLIFSICAGAVGSLAHAPLAFGPFILVPLLAGFVLLRVARQARLALFSGWALGFGYFMPTLSWITEPFQVDAATTGWMAPFALVLLALLLGSFWAAAVWFGHWAGGRAYVLVLAWTGTEMLRAYVFTGFPWASPPQALVDGFAGQGLAWLGPHGLMLCMTALAALALAPVI